MSDAAALIDEIATITGETDSAYETTILKYLNKYYKQLEYILKFPEMINDDTVEIPSYYNTGTITVTNSSATVTGSGTAFAAAHAGWYFKVEGISDVFEVSTRDSATQLTLADNWPRDTLAGKKYWLYKLVYSLPADFNKMLSVTQGDTPLLVKERSIEQMDAMWKAPYRWQTGAPRNVTIYKNSANFDGTLATALSQMIVTPFSDAIYQLQIKYMRHLTLLTNAASSYPVFDDARLDSYLVDRTCSRIFLDKEDNRFKTYKQESNESLIILKSFFENRAGDDDRFVLEAGTLSREDMVDRVSRDTSIG